MFKFAKELISPIEHDGIDYRENEIYRIEDICNIRLEQFIGGDTWEIVFYDKENRRTTFATFPFSPEYRDLEGRKAYEKAKHYFKNIYNNLKE